MSSSSRLHEETSSEIEDYTLERERAPLNDPHVLRIEHSDGRRWFERVHAAVKHKCERNCPTVLHLVHRAGDIYTRYNLKKYLIIWWILRILLLIMWYFLWYKKEATPGVASPSVGGSSKPLLPAVVSHVSMLHVINSTVPLSAPFQQQKDDLPSKPSEAEATRIIYHSSHIPPSAVTTTAIATTSARCGWSNTKDRGDSGTGTTCVFGGSLAFVKNQDNSPPYGTLYVFGLHKSVPTQFPADDTRQGMLQYHKFSGLRVRQPSSRTQSVVPMTDCKFEEQSPVVMFHSSSPDNLYHALVNNIIPLLSTLYEFAPGPRPKLDFGSSLEHDPILVTAAVTRLHEITRVWKVYQLDPNGYSHIWGGLQQLSLQSGITHMTNLTSTYIPTSSSKTYDICFLNRTVVGIGAPKTSRLPWSVVKSYLLSRLDETSDVPAPPEHTSRKLSAQTHPETKRKPHVILVVRDPTSARGRIFLNQDELVKTLKHFEATGEITANVINFSGMSYSQQIQVAKNANIMVGAHGAGLTWFAFAPEASVLAQITPWGAGDGELKFLYEHHANLHHQSKVITLEVSMNPNEGDVVECTNKNHIRLEDCKGTIWMNFAISPSRFKRLIQDAIQAWKGLQQEQLFYQIQQTRLQRKKV